MVQARALLSENVAVVLIALGSIPRSSLPQPVVVMDTKTP